MALSIRDPETDRLARELSSVTGETMTQAIRTAVRERLDRTRRLRTAEQQERFDKAMEIARRCSSKPLLDSRTPDEIIGYDEHGLPR